MMQHIEHSPNITPENSAEPSRLQRIIKGAVPFAVVGLLITGCFAGNEQRERTQDLIGDASWEYMPGVMPEDDMLHISHTGLAVLELEEPGRPDETPHYTATPPINMWGTHLELRDTDIKVQAELEDIKGNATISFLNSPPTRHDEQVMHPAGVSVEVEGKQANVRLFDGKDNEPFFEQERRLSVAATDVAISLVQTSEGAGVVVNDEPIKLPVQPLRDSVWFGFDASDSWNLTDLTAKGRFASVSGMDIAASADVSGIRNDIDDKKYFGTAVDPSVLAANKHYASFVNANFTEIEPEMAGKMQVLQPEEDRFEFAELDGLVSWAEKTNKEVHGHTLAFTEAYPEWLHERLTDPEITKPEVEALLRDHIQTVVSRYDGKHGHGTINAWDVVNEPFDPEHWGEINRQNIWYKHLGEEYIDIALRAAHEANPEAKLFINEWGMETDDDRFAAMIALIERLKDAGVPVDGVGFQAHFDEATLSDDELMDKLYGGELLERFKQLSDMGLQVRISETSVAENSDPDAQKDVYAMLVENCRQVSACVGVNIWGATTSSYQDRYFYFTGNNTRKDPGNDAPTLQKEDGTIVYRPAWYGIKDALTSSD